MRAREHRFRIGVRLALALALSSCGSDRFQHSEAGNPFPGTEPFSKFDTDPEQSNAFGIQSLVFVDPLGPLAEPFLVERIDERMLYYGAADGSIRLVRAPTGSFDWGSPETVLEAELPWEASGLTGPTVLARSGVGFELWYAALDGSGIGRAESDDGRNWVRRPVTPVLEPEATWEAGSVASPSVTRDADGDWWMAYAGEAGIGLARSPDGLVWTRVDGDEGRVGLQPALRPGDPSAWDALAVRAPALEIERSPLGREVFRLVYEGEGHLDAVLGSVLDSSLGEAASFGPSRWVRFEGNPVVAEVPPLALGVGVAEGQPAVVGSWGERCLVFATRSGRGGAVGVGAAGQGDVCSSSGI